VGLGFGLDDGDGDGDGVGVVNEPVEQPASTSALTSTDHSRAVIRVDRPTCPPRCVAAARRSAARSAHVRPVGARSQAGPADAANFPDSAKRSIHVGDGVRNHPGAQGDDHIG
jgi:hypothetical protein